MQRSIPPAAARTLRINVEFAPSREIVMRPADGATPPTAHIQNARRPHSEEPVTSPTTLAAIRFGTGLSPGAARGDDAGSLLAALAEPDRAAETYPVRPFAYWRGYARELSTARTARRMNEPGAEAAFDDLASARALVVHADMTAFLARTAYGPSGFRERLTLFWANHFTTAGRGAYRTPTVAHIDEAIRPNLTGSFSDLLRAAALHPAMLYYLDQSRSAGPNSEVGLKGRRGLNENLARELLELHTLGAAGGYSQTDVEGLALLLTGATFTTDDGFKFRRSMAEPGEIAVLGRTYGREQPRLADIETALDDIAAHPDTARHVATRLARHFVADDPDPDLVAHLEARYLATGGALTPVYEALLEHPSAWAPDLRKVRPPYDFVVASIRALGVSAETLTGMSAKDAAAQLGRPMGRMGQPFLQAPDPAGWPDSGTEWITPQGLAARIAWSMTAPRRLAGEQDPRLLLDAALSDAADDDLRRAAAGAETRWEGVGIILASPAFNRR